MNTAAGESRTLVAVVPPGERGATRIADRVVAKIASQAAREALGVPPPEGSSPHATVAVHRHAHESARAGGTPVDVARVRVHVELGYPCDIGARCHDVRRQVMERVSALVGMEVPEVAVQVERLHLSAAHGAAQGRTR